MERSVIKMTVKFILISSESFLLLVFIMPIFRRVVNAGNICGIALSAALLSATVFSDKLFAVIKEIWQTAGGKVLIVFTAFLLTAAIIYAAVLSALMMSAYSDPPEEPTNVIVLGCKVRGSTPSQMLRYRLDAAYNYLCENEDTICIVSGGKGAGEDISEAEAMKTYLVEKGISPDRIITEDKSTSTEENLKNSAEILRSLGLPTEAVIISDGYHQYRASLIAKSVGFEKTYSVSGKTKAYLLPTYWVREWLALTEQLLIK